MLYPLAQRAFAIALIVALDAPVDHARAEGHDWRRVFAFELAQSDAPKETAPDEAEKILQDSKKQDPETPKEIAECLSQWGPQTQMTKEEWAASCRSTLRYFPQSR